MAGQPAKKPASKSNWFLWWMIDPAEVDRQVAGYKNLGFLASARGVAVACLLASCVITVGMIAFKVVPLSGLIDMAVMLIVAVFIYLGHRWASIAAMVLWTLEKAVTMVAGFTGAASNPGVGIAQVVWWCVYMHAFYLAFRVEQRRRAIATGRVSDAEVFD